MDTIQQSVIDKLATQVVMLEMEVEKYKTQLYLIKDRMIQLSDDLDEGRRYLMGVNPKDLSVEDVLESFGFGRDGLK